MRTSVVAGALLAALVGALTGACGNKAPEQATPDPSIAAANAELAAAAYVFAHPW